MLPQHVSAGYRIGQVPRPNTNVAFKLLNHQSEFSVGRKSGTIRLLTAQPEIAARIHVLDVLVTSCTNHCKKHLIVVTVEQEALNIPQQLPSITCRDNVSRPRRVQRSAIQLPDASSGISIAPFIEASVAETAPRGYFITQVPASFSNAGNLGSLVFRIVAGNADGLFTIDENSGNITLSKLLDYESSQRHQLTVTASVRNSVSRSATSDVRINVVEINEHSPVFVFPLGQFTLHGYCG